MGIISAVAVRFRSATAPHYNFGVHGIRAVRNQDRKYFDIGIILFIEQLYPEISVIRVIIYYSKCT